MAALAGFVDAIGFLSANGYFVSFMSGNSTRMAAQVLVKPWNALAGLGLIAGFLFGVALGTLVADRAQPRPAPAVLWLVTALLALAGVVEFTGNTVIELALLTMAMGALNNAFRVPGQGASPGVTYMTGAVVRLGQAIGGRIAGHRDPGARTALVLWLSLVGGGLAGAAAFLLLPHAGLPLAALAALMLQRRSTAIARSRAGR